MKDAKKLAKSHMKKAKKKKKKLFFLHFRGEGAFSILSEYEYLWPADSMKPHLIKLTKSVPITFIYGETSPFHN